MRAILVVTLSLSLFGCKLSQGYKLADAGGGSLGGCIATKKAAEEDVRLADWLRGIAGGADYPELRDAAAVTLATIGTAINSEGDFAKVVEVLGGMDGASKKLFVTEGKITIDGKVVDVGTNGVEARLLARFLNFFSDPSVTMADKVSIARQLQETSTRTADAIATNKTEYGQRILALLRSIHEKIKGAINTLKAGNISAEDRRLLVAMDASRQLADLEARMAVGEISAATARPQAEVLARSALANIPENLRADVTKDIGTSLLGVEYQLRLQNKNNTDTGLGKIAGEAMRAYPDALAEISTLEAVRIAAISASAGDYDMARTFIQHGKTFAGNRSLAGTPVMGHLNAVGGVASGTNFDTVFANVATSVREVQRSRSQPWSARSKARYEAFRSKARL